METPYQDNDEESLDEYISTILNKDFIKKGEKGSGFRNFIANNVIESSRFKYLVRYGNPQKIHALANNRMVIDFVLKEIPDDQILAYYKSCKEIKRKYSPEMRDVLADIITGLHFRDFEDIRSNQGDSPEKEQRKNVIRLYLTVLYLLQKNLIYVNSRYFLAFQCAERDAFICDPKKYTEKRLVYIKDTVKALVPDGDRYMNNHPYGMIRRKIFWVIPFFCLIAAYSLDDLLFRNSNLLKDCNCVKGMTKASIHSDYQMIIELYWRLKYKAMNKDMKHR